MDLRLTNEHRAILFNQFKILSLINSDNDEKIYYEKIAEALQNGYEIDYGNLNIYKSFGVSNCREVRETLNLFTILLNSYDELSSNEKMQIDQEQLKFRGYDGHGHDGLDFQPYVEFIHRHAIKGHAENESWISKISTDMAKNDNFDSHSCISRTSYQQMLKRWKKLGSPTSLNLEQIRQIVQNQ